ncbi:MAG: glycosyltransferase family 2 protein [Deltaproteobacteria bacterium]
MTKLSIVIPVYNSEKSIGPLCERLIELYSKIFKLEIVLVNDYSKDNSDGVCKRLQSEHSAIITYIRLSRNFGEHNAVMAGLNYATGDYCVIMDDDLQNPPEEVVKLLDKIMKGYDVVYTRYSSKKHNIFRNLGSRFNDKVANMLLKKPVDLYLSSFKIINRFVVNEIIKYTGPDPYIDGIILRTTRNISSVDVGHEERRVGKSGYSLGKLISIWGNTVVSFSLLPLRLLGLIGFLMVSTGSIYGAIKYIWGNEPFALTEFETIVSFGFFFRGILLMATGLVGEYVGRIYLFLNREPQFVIREILTSVKVKDAEQFVGQDERRQFERKS